MPISHAFQIADVDHRDRAIAQELHALQQAAYAQEAQLIGAAHFPPLLRTLGDLKGEDAQYLAAWQHGRIVGAISLELDAKNPCAAISSLTVLPCCHRQGIGAGLLAAATAAHPQRELHVQTAVRNLPAIALYLKAGFEQARRWHASDADLELVALVRSESATAALAA